ncbi:MAG: sensor histidine kinase [Bryobacteraceae bacterium]
MKRRSIGFRLASWYSVVFAGGLAVFSVAVWFAMRATVYHAIDDELRDRVQGVRAFMDRQISALSILEIRDEFREHSVLGPGGDLFQVCDSQGQWLYRSVPLESNNVGIEKPSDLDRSTLATTQVAGRPLRFYSERILVNGQAYTVQVAAPMHEAFEAIEAFGLILVLAVPVLLIAATAGGYWISKRALDPVDEISRAAQRISIENLTDRLDVPRTGDQLQRLTETLNQMFSRLEASVRRMKQFTADASHELRAPIALIRTTAEVAVQRRNRQAAEYLEALDDILEESERNIAGSRQPDAPGAGGCRQGGTRAQVDASAIARAAGEQGEKLARIRGLDFSASIPDKPVWVHADAEALRRALLILIDNAAKYTPEKGSVRIKLSTNDAFARFSVSDSGIGIAPADLPHIFDRFWRADKARSRSQGGAGLGLSIAKWIAETHAGSITVESESGKGSVFSLNVPLER